MSDEREDQRGTPPGAGTHVPPQGGAIGNPPHEVTDEKREQVRKLAGLQVSQAEIANVMGVSVDTIQRHYSKEFEDGRVAMSVRFRKSLFTRALGVRENPDDETSPYKKGCHPSDLMAIFVAKTQFGFVETTRQQLTGDEGKPIEIAHIRRVVVDPKAEG